MHKVSLHDKIHGFIVFSFIGLLLIHCEKITTGRSCRFIYSSGFFYKLSGFVSVFKFYVIYQIKALKVIIVNGNN